MTSISRATRDKDQNQNPLKPLFAIIRPMPINSQNKKAKGTNFNHTNLQAEYAWLSCKTEPEQVLISIA